MNTKIYCKITKNVFNSFYMEYEGITYYLFTQDFHAGVNKYFKNGVRLNDAMKMNKGDFCVRKTKEKFKSHIKYLEEIYSIYVLDETVKKASNKRHCSKRDIEACITMSSKVADYQFEDDLESFN